MPLHLTEDDVTGLLDAAGALVVIEDCLRRMAAGAVARAGAATMGLIGCGGQAAARLAAVRAAVPSIKRAWCRKPDRLRAFCEQTVRRRPRAARRPPNATSSSR